MSEGKTIDVSIVAAMVASFSKTLEKCEGLWVESVVLTDGEFNYEISRSVTEVFHEKTARANAQPPPAAEDPMVVPEEAP